MPEEKAKILIVEDDGIIAARLRSILAKYGYMDVGPATSGEEAIELAETMHPDLLLMDIRLQGKMTGIEAAAHIHEKMRIPVIYLSAYSDDQLLSQARATEPYGYLIKPVQDREVYVTVEMALARAKLDQKLRESEERYRRLAELALEGIWAVDLAGLTVYANPRLAQMLALPPHEIMGRPIFDFLSSENAEVCKGAMERARSGSREKCDLELIGKSGQRIYASLAFAPIEDRTGRQGTLAVVNDITERRQVEEELQRSAKLESIGLLAGGIAHDFNNLLTAIAGNVSLALSDVWRDSRAAEYLLNIESAVMRARDLTQQLLSFARGGAPVKRVLALNRLIREAVRLACTGSPHECKVEISDDLWPAEVDEGQIGQVLNNITLNACQAMPTPGLIDVRAYNLKVESSSALPLPHGDYLVVEIEDHGTGISPDNLARIFDPFFTTKPRGSGLGLSSVYSIVRAHGGHVTVKSNLGTGSTFFVYLPAAPGRKAEERPQKNAAATSPKRVLVMDDEALLRNMLVEMLALLGHQAVAVEDGESALVRYKEAMSGGQGFDLVILDLTIRGGAGGAEVVKQLRAFDPQVQAVASSGYASDTVMSNFRNYGFAARLAKPYRIQDLQEVIANVLGSGR